MIRSDVRDGVTIRNPSTANLLIDSRDSGFGYPSNFTIAKNNSILNGFFSRIGVTEVILQWNNQNVSAVIGNNSLTVVIATVPYTGIIAAGNYNIAECLDALVISLNAAAGAAGTFSITQGVGFAFLSCTVAFTVTPGILAGLLSLSVTGPLTANPVSAP